MMIPSVKSENIVSDMLVRIPKGPRRLLQQLGMKSPKAEYLRMGYTDPEIN
jgi:hypothetical protein